MAVIRRLAALGFAALAALYALYAVALTSFQDALIFPAPQIPRDAMDRAAAGSGAVPFELTADDGVRLYGWHVPGDGDRALVYFHGNGSHAGGAGWFGEQLPGVDVFSISYRGYPGSDGSPSEAGLARDARALWAHVLGIGFRPERVVVQGQSLGGGVAHHLLTAVRPAGAVFDSTFHSLEEIAAGAHPLLPVRLLLRHPFRSFERAPRVTVPALVLHGDADHLIPVDHGRRLAKLLPNAAYHEVPGWGHDRWLLDHPDAYARWQAFLASVWAR